MDYHNLSQDALLIENIGELVTLGPLAKKQARQGVIDSDDLGILKNAWLLLDHGKVKAHGSGQAPIELASKQRFDASGRLVTPGFIDCHTHPIFGGDRAHEFAMRVEGKTYQEIAAAGGGIRSTVQMTRESSSEYLQESCLKRLQTFLSHGVTTVEVKSGYGGSPNEELRLLRILNKIAKQSTQEISITCLGLHAKTDGYPTPAAYVHAMTNELLPIVAEENLAEWVDAFVENGYFSVEDCELYMQRAKQLGLKIRIHADEFRDSAAAAAAARWQAYSADHLEEASPEGLAAMSRQGTIAVLLPGTSLYTKLPFVQASLIRQHNCLMAIASDFNPGSCQIDNLPLLASVASVHCGLSVAETIAAVTFIPALALNLGDRKGCLAPGYDADVIVHSLSSKEQWLADFGRNRPQIIFIAGKKQRLES